MKNMSNEIKFQLITFDRMINEKMLLIELDKRGLRLPTEEEIRAFQKSTVQKSRMPTKKIHDGEWNESYRFLIILR